MSTPEKETLEARVEREMAELRDRGIVEKAPPTITRSTLDRLSLKEQSAFFRAGGKVTDDPAPTKKPLPPGAILRSTWEKMSPQESTEFFAKGGSIVDDADYISPQASGTLLTRAAFCELDVREQVKFIEAGGTVTD